MRRILPAFLLSLLVAACGGGGSDGAEAPLPTLEPGGLVAASAKSFKPLVRSFGAKPVVVNFWATWCGPCKEEMPRFVEAARAYGDDVQFLGVNVEDDPEAARAFIRANDIRFPSLADPRGEIRRAEQVVGLPATQFYRADGELAFVHAGEITEEELRERIDELLKIGRPATSAGS